MKKLVTAHNFVPRGFSPREKKPSLTVPGQVLPLRTVLERFRRGQSVQSFNPVYNEDFPPGYESLDKIERIEMARSAAADVQRMRRALADKQKRSEQPETLPSPEPPAPEQ